MAESNAEQLKKDVEDKMIGRHMLTGNGPKVQSLLNELFADRISFTPGDPYTTAFKEGQRDVVGFLRTCIEFVQTTPEEGD